jgi:hypothetical protein
VNGNLGSVALVKKLDGKVLRPPFFKRYQPEMERPAMTSGKATRLN